MTKEEFKAKFMDGFDKFVKSSKKAFGKAGSAVQDFSDKSVIRIEKKQYESKRDGLYEKLGKIVADSLIENPSAAIDFSSQEIVSIIEDVKKYTDEIKNREDLLSKEKQFDTESENTSSSEKSDN